MRSGVFVGMAVAAVLCAAPAWGASISIDSKAITVGTASVGVPVRISGGENIAALALTLVIGDGGSELGGSETIKVTSFDTTGGIFDGPFTINKGYGEPLPSAATIVNIAITTANTDVPANGLVGMLWLDTTSATTPRVVTLAPTYTPLPTTGSNSLSQPLTLSFTNGALTVNAHLPGDADDSGRVDFNDFLAIDAGYLFGGSGWANGDFDGNGTINGADYAIIKAAFNAQGAPAGAPEFAMAGMAGVPEPATLTLVAGGAALLLGRRQRPLAGRVTTTR